MDGLEFILDLAVVALVAGLMALVCRRAGLSAVVGFLVAGIIVGPHTPPFQLVGNADRVRMLADLGLIFLVFGIGLGFSVRRMQRLGIALVAATGAAALLVLALVRLGTAFLGLSTQQGLFVAAVLMVSSSAIISKVLEEIGSNHTRWGQLALGVTLLEDIVAVVMLTLLSSLSVAEGGRESSLWQTLTSFTGFVAVFFLAVLMLVPRLLKRLSRSASTEILMLLTTGLLLVLGWVAVRLGYSMALTAFILGAIIGSTPQRADVERLFEGMRHLFGAVFFVAMGMMFEVSRIGEFWPVMLGLTAAAFLLRIPSVALALALAGNRIRDSFRAAMTLTPLGEFSFVIALLGVQSGVMPETFYPAAVGASLLTCVLAPLLIRRAQPLGKAAEAALPGAVRRRAEDYRDWLDRMEESRSRNEVWNAVFPVAVRTLLQLLAIAGVLALIAPGFRLATDTYGPDVLFRSGTVILFTIASGMLVLGPVLAVWRNLSRISCVLAETGARADRSGPLGKVLHRGFTAGLASLAALWIIAVVPAEAISAPLLWAVVLILAAVMFFLWRDLAAWQERLEARVRAELEGAAREGDESAGWKLGAVQGGVEWRLQVQEVTIPSTSLHAGRPLADLNLRADWRCSVVGIDRGGFAINNPSAQERVYPGDTLLLLGETAALAAAQAFLEQSADRPEWLQQFDDLGTESVEVPPAGACVGRTLRDLDLPRRLGVQVGGIRRDGTEIVSPGAVETLRAGDQVLLLGSHASIRRFKETACRVPGDLPV